MLTKSEWLLDLTVFNILHGVLNMFKDRTLVEAHASDCVQIVLFLFFNEFLWHFYLHRHRLWVAFSLFGKEGYDILRFCHLAASRIVQSWERNFKDCFQRWSIIVFSWVFRWLLIIVFELCLSLTAPKIFINVSHSAEIAVLLIPHDWELRRINLWSWASSNFHQPLVWIYELPLPNRLVYEHFNLFLIFLDLLFCSFQFTFSQNDIFLQDCCIPDEFFLIINCISIFTLLEVNLTLQDDAFFVGPYYLH